MAPLNRRDLQAYMDDKTLPFPERVARLMTYQAALYVLTGGDTPETMDFEDTVDTEELEKCAKSLREMGIEDYAKSAYGGEAEEKVDLKALKYQYFLYQTVDELNLPAIQYVAVKEGLRNKLLSWEEKGKVPCQDHWLSKYPEQQEAKKTPLREEDRSVYEYAAPDDVWKDYVAAAYRKKGWGARPLDAKTVDKIKTHPDYVFDQLTLRNKRTVEHVKRGELDDVVEARMAARRSFSFLRPQDLRAAQNSARSLGEQMRGCTGAVTQTPEWQALTAAVDAFTAAKTSGTAAQASANVLLAVEKFTKGKKNANQSPEVSQCVNLALKALGTTIPDAARNPSVKPLVDRFNQVRRQRLQFGSLVTLEDNKALSMNATNEEILAPWDRQVQAFTDKELSGKTAGTELYGAEPINEATAREHIAIAIAVEEARKGGLNPRKDLESRTRL